MLIPELEQFAVKVEDEKTLYAICRYLNNLISKRTRSSVVKMAVTVGEWRKLTKAEALLVRKINACLAEGKLILVPIMDDRRPLHPYSLDALSSRVWLIPYLTHTLLQLEDQAVSFWIRLPVEIEGRLYTIDHAAENYLYISKEGRWCTIVSEWKCGTLQRAYVSGTDQAIYHLLMSEELS